MADNQSYSYFISLMEKVLSTLEPCFAVLADAESTEAASSESIFETLDNRFDLLEVEEPVEPKTGLHRNPNNPSTSFKPQRKRIKMKRTSLLYSVSLMTWLSCAHM